MSSPAAPDRTQLAAAIGPAAAHYLPRFERIEAAGGGWVATWNWPAFFCSSAWFAYRRMHGYSLANSLLAIVAAILAASHPASALLVLAGWMVFSFLLVPMYANQLYYRRLKQRLAGNEGKTGKSLRPPAALAGVKAFLVAILSFGIPAFIVMAPAMYADYTPRARVSESLAMAASLKEAVGVFHAQHRRFPAAHELEKARLDPGRDGRSLVYDSQQQSIVITMGDRDYSLKGKRFALRAEVRDGAIHWNCRTIDLDRKYLPAACRGD